MRTLLVCTTFCFSLIMQAQYVFEINDFKAFNQDLSMIAATTFESTKLRLTPAAQGLEGACWYSKNKIFLNEGFETEFTFLISGNDDPDKRGDGFAFVIHNQNPEVVGGTGDAIGYKGIPFAMAVEFDTHDDGEGSRNHINLSFYNATTRSYRRYATVHDIPEITDGEAHFTKINYLDGNLEVYLDSYLFPVLSVRIDIAEKILSQDGYAWMGFTSATSQAYANHDLLQWNLKEYLPPPPDLAEEKIEVINAHQIAVKGRKLRIRVWDHNRIDGDVISLKWGDEWILTDYLLKEEPHTINLTLHGFNEQLILFAGNVGMIPPNTASVSIYDGHSLQKVELESDLEKSESLVVQFSP